MTDFFNFARVLSRATQESRPKGNSWTLKDGLANTFHLIMISAKVCHVCLLYSFIAFGDGMILIFCSNPDGTATTEYKRESCGAEQASRLMMISFMNKFLPIESFMNKFLMISFMNSV